MLGSNSTDQEVLNYGTDEEKILRFEKLIEDQPDHNKEIEQLEKQIDLVKEQKYFASDLLKEIRSILKEETRAKTIKERISLAFENSYHEE